ncbi:MAG: ComEC/Rec2 family competence protein, partial [Oscillospiraceae bacterium]|nr:ComEC/Rec2 family competence protein [Oscillospiraceae bacterium]
YTYGDEIIAITKLHEPAPAKFRGDFDTRIFCLSRGLRFIQNTKGDMISFIGNENRISIGRLAFNVRKSMWNSAKNLLPPNEAALAQGIMIGDKSAFTDEMRDNFKASGMAHLTALSGIHINIISMVLFYIIVAASRKRVLLNIFMAIGIIAFYIIVGYTPSILRAVIMALLAIAGNFIWRRSDALNALGLSALLILLFVPYALFDVAFQLSFMAVLGMAIFLKPLNIEIIKKSKLTLILPTVSVLLTTSIITAYAFNIVNFTAIWANIFVFPLFTFGLFGSYLMSILDAIWQPLGVFASHSVYAALFLMNKIIDISAHYASVYLRVSSPGYIEVAIYSAFLYLVYQIEVAVIKKWLERPSWDLR